MLNTSFNVLACHAKLLLCKNTNGVSPKAAQRTVASLNRLEKLDESCRP